jgi:hypothetical protein
MDFKGPIVMANPQEEFAIVESHELDELRSRDETLRRVFFGRKVSQMLPK